MRHLTATLVVLTAAAPGCGGDDNPHDGAAALCVDTINMYRATLDLEPLTRWEDAEECSNDEAAQDAASGQAHGAFGQCDERAQNECPGWPGPPSEMIEDCLAAMWAEGPGEDFGAHGHYLNMSNTSFSQVACGFHRTDEGRIWAVQDFR